MTTRAAIDVIREDIRLTYEQVRKMPVPHGFTSGKPFTGIVPRVSAGVYNGAPSSLSLAEMMNIRTVSFVWHFVIRNGQPIWWIAGTLDGVEHIVDGPARLE